MMSRLFLLGVLVLIGSCGASIQKESAPEITTQKTADEILFGMFKMTKTDSGNAIVMTSTQIAKGKMKPELTRPVDSGNYLTVEIFQDEKLTESRRIEHPLLKNVEYLNESNQFKTQAVTQDEGEFFIRLQKKGLTKIRISETINNKTLNQWQTFTITP